MAFLAEKEKMSIRHQCELLEIPRSSFYHGSGIPDSKAMDELLMREMDRVYLEEPTYECRRLGDELKLMGYEVGRIPR